MSTCLLSHWHHDHIGGFADLLRICPDAKIFKHTPSLDPDGILDGRQVGFEDGQTFIVGDDAERFGVRALHCPGHTKDHVAFVVSQSSNSGEVGCMFTGDNVLGHGTAVFEDLATYLDSLHIMSQHMPEGKRAFPAHGEVIEDGHGKIEMYIEHRQQREDEALRVLKTGRAEEPSSEEPGVEILMKEWESMEIVKVIYKDVPESLHEPAEKGLLQVLRKLENEGKVFRTESGKWRVGKKAAL